MIAVRVGRMMSSLIVVHFEIDFELRIISWVLIEGYCIHSTRDVYKHMYGDIPSFP